MRKRKTRTPSGPPSRASVPVAVRFPVELYAEVVEVAGERIQEGLAGSLWPTGEYRPLEPGETLKRFVLDAAQRELTHRRKCIRDRAQSARVA